MEWTIGSTSRPYAQLSYQEAYERIAGAGYTDLAVFANQGQVPVNSDSSSEEVAGVRRAAAAAGLSPSMLIGRTNLDLGLEKGIDDYKKLVDNAASLGV